MVLKKKREAKKEKKTTSGQVGQLVGRRPQLEAVCWLGLGESRVF